MYGAVDFTSRRGRVYRSISKVYTIAIRRMRFASEIGYKERHAGVHDAHAQRGEEWDALEMSTEERMKDTGPRELSSYGYLNHMLYVGSFQHGNPATS